jgi:hypothetical protein
MHVSQVWCDTYFFEFWRNYGLCTNMIDDPTRNTLLSWWTEEALHSFQPFPIQSRVLLSSSVFSTFLSSRDGNRQALALLVSLPLGKTRQAAAAFLRHPSFCLLRKTRSVVFQLLYFVEVRIFRSLSLSCLKIAIFSSSTSPSRQTKFPAGQRATLTQSYLSLLAVGFLATWGLTSPHKVFQRKPHTVKLSKNRSSQESRANNGGFTVVVSDLRESRSILSQFFFLFMFLLQMKLQIVKNKSWL